MSCFYGKFNYQLDAKGRMRLPAKYRADMGNNYLLLKGAGGCISVLGDEALNALNKKLKELPLSDVEGARAIRNITSFAVDVECDEQGRFILPLDLKKFAKIDKNVCIAGAGNKIEIWAQEIWEAENADQSVQSYEEALKSLAKYGV